MRVLMIGLLVLALAACTQESEDTELTITTTTTSATTTSTVATTTEPAEPETDDESGADESQTTQVGMAVEGYDIAVRSSTPEGEVLHVVIDPGTYTDIDLENFVVATLDERDLAEFHVYDDRDAVDAALVDADERSEAEQALVDDHYLVSFTDGNVITFRGPFADVGAVRIGS